MTKNAILEVMRDRGLRPDQTISLYDVAIPLMPKGYTIGDLVDALYALENKGVIKLLDGNQLRILRPL